MDNYPSDSTLTTQFRHFLDSVAVVNDTSILHDDYYINIIQEDPSCTEHCSNQFAEFFTDDSTTSLFFVGKLVSFEFDFPDVQYIDNYGLLDPLYPKINVNEFLPDFER